jgi:SAM-dependent methyltransferase
MDTWQLVLLTILILLLLNYAYFVFYDRLVQKDIHGVEGFEEEMSSHGWHDEPYDQFYATIYNKIFQHDKLVQAEASTALHEWKKTDKSGHLRILDVCCGTGVATCFFAKQDVDQATGLDKSVAMLNYAKDIVVPATTLTEQQKMRLEWKPTDAYAPMACQASEFTHACLLFFSIYYFKDLDVLFKNLALWIKPGGGLVIEVVNKHKFEPVPDVANPWIAVSPQKHTKDRITTSKAAFDKFDYDTEFHLEGNEAEFNETFKFKDGKVRRQKHTLYMPSISKIVTIAVEQGFAYDKFMDLQFMGFNYGYLLFFTRKVE